MSDTALLALCGCVVLGTLGLGFIALRGARTVAMRLVALAVAGLLATSAYAAGERVLGRARPLNLDALAAADDARVLYAQAIPQDGIYLLVDTGAAPLYYRIAWTEQGEQQLRGALQTAEESQTGVMVRLETDRDDLEPMFYAEPQPAFPAKTPETAPAYRDREWRS